MGIKREVASIKELKESKEEIEALKSENAQLKKELKINAEKLDSIQSYICFKDSAASICGN